MKQWILFLVVFSLAACGGDDGPRPVPTSATPEPTASPTESEPTLTVAPVVSTPTSTHKDVEPATPLPSPTAPSPSNLYGLTSSRLLPVQVAETTLDTSASVCAGDGLSVISDGTVYTLGWRDDQPCASAIDLKTGSVAPADPSALPPLSDATLEAFDPTRERVYIAESGVVTAFDTDGQEIGPVLTLPPGEPKGASSDTGLRLDEATNRLYLSYQDFDGQAWIASADLTTGEIVADVPVPGGPWALTDDGRILFADESTLLILDGADLEVIGRLSLSRRPVAAVADPTGSRLFVADAGGDLHVLDSTTLAELDRLPGVGAALDLDPRLGQLYLGDRYSGGVHIFDHATLEPLGRIPQPGQPVASPADGMIYILEEDVYQANGATLQLATSRTTRNSGCSGCVYPTGIVVDPRRSQVYTITYGVWIGKPGPTDQATVDPLTGHAYVAHTTGGYQPVYSLALFPDLAQGQPIRWIDGLYGQPLYNSVSDQLYLALNDRLLFLEGQTLELLGGITVGDQLKLLTIDASNGWLYAAQEDRLLAFETKGPVAQASAPETIEQLPGPIYGIVVSPAFAQDATLFVQATNWETGRFDMYRSHDGGQSWERLGGALPGPPNDLVFAPDGRLYAALAAIGWRAAPEAAIQGEGVYVSEDGGDSWQAYNTGLTHLRVGRLHVKDSGVLFAQTAASPELGHAASGPTIWSRPPGQDWTPLAVPDAGPLRLVDYAIPATYTLAVRAYWHELTGGGSLYQAWGGELRRSDDGGQTWQTVGPGPTDYAEDVVSGKESIYWIGPDALWRSTDAGNTWAALAHSALDGPPFAMTVADVNGAETLFMGTEAGQVLIVSVSEANWKSLDR